ncbi:anti-sigma factor, partial [Nonomuraea mesophila]
MNDDLHDPHALAGAHAAHALPYVERLLFEDHLRECPGCEAEVRRLRETLAALADAAAVPPPATLRARLLTAATLPSGPPADVPAGCPAEAWR